MCVINWSPGSVYILRKILTLFWAPTDTARQQSTRLLNQFHKILDTHEKMVYKQFTNSIRSVK